MAQINGLVLPFQIPAISASIPTRLPMSFPPLNRLPWLTTFPTAGTPPLPGPPPTPPVPNKLNALYDERNQISPWFDMMHALPRRIDLGRVLATTVIDMTVHNAYRSQVVTWNSFVNGAGAGTVLTGPTPPQILSPQESTVGLQLQITTDGVPVVDDTLDFGYTTPDLNLVPISFSRLVFFPIFPQEGITERLGFLTDILASKDGTEKRASVRRFPRISYQLRFREEARNAALLQNFMLGRPGSTYGIPLWHESTIVTAETLAGAATIPVRDTKYRQFVTGGVGVAYIDENTYDIFQIASFTDTEIVPVNPTVLDLPPGTLVMPVRLATATNRQRGSRWPVNLSQLAVTFEVRDVDALDLADASAWPTYNGAVLVDDCNALGRGSVSETITSTLFVVDGEAGPVEKSAFILNGRYGSRKQWAPRGIEKLWNVRGLLYALNGRQVSFYMPTDRSDLEPIADLNSGSSTLSVVFAGVTYVFGNGYRDHVRVTLNDGTEITNEILDVTGNEAQTEEYLALATPWASTVPFADIARIEYLQRVRLDSDEIQLRYEPGRSGARVTIPTKTVLGE